MNSKKLQDITDYKVMNMEECFKALDWDYTVEDEQFTNIQCKCGSEMEFR